MKERGVFLLFLCSDISSLIRLNYLHTLSPPVIHRDIKSHNIMLSQEKSSLVAKLADFGVCWVGNSAAGRVVDNPVWLAPEVRAGKGREENGRQGRERKGWEREGKRRREGKKEK